MTLIDQRDLHNSLVRLYDPPEHGATPLDGAGNPRTSQVKAVDVDAKIALGFTREPVLAAKPEAPHEEAPPPSLRRGRA